MSQSLPPPPVTRPAGVTFVVILGWISAVLSMAVGVYLIFNAGNRTVQAELGAGADSVRTVGYIVFLLGVLTAVLIYALGKGSNLVRILLSLVLILRIIADVVLLAQYGNRYLGPVIVAILVNLFLLSLLWTSKASAFFKQ